MLHEFVTSHRNALISRCQNKAALRFTPSKAPATIDYGVPLFLEQLVDILRLAQTGAGSDSEAEPEPAPAPTEIGRTAALHGTELLRLGYSVDQVVHGYGDVCQSVTELAIEENAQISADEFRTLNLCLDNAIADAVTSFGRSRQLVINDQAETLHQRLDSFSDEHKRLADIAIQAYGAIKRGNIGFSGATGTLLGHTLEELRYLPARALPDIRLASATTTIVPPSQEQKH